MQNRTTVEARKKYYLKLSGLDESLVPADTANFNGIPNEIVTVDGNSGLKDNPVHYSINVDGEAVNLDRIDEWKLLRGNNEDIVLDQSFTLSVDPEPLNKLEELMMVVKYRF